MEEPLRPPIPAGTEVCRFRAFARPKHKFKTILSAQTLFGTTGSTEAVVETRHQGQRLEVDLRFGLSGAVWHDHLTCTLAGGLQAEHLLRRVLTPDGTVSRQHDVWFQRPPFALPTTTYPEVMLPFLLRGWVADKQRRALHAWTNDGFCARVWYEHRGRERLDVPAGRFEVDVLWMYPDLNDWIALGGALTALAKPLLPRYSMWFEVGGARRLVRFEGPYGPPGAPEIVVELAG
jgi:hypothetical protein